MSANRDGTAGYCFLGGTVSGGVSFTGSSRSEAARKIRVVVDPAGVAAPTAKVYVSGADLALPGSPTVEVPLPAEYLAASTFKFGFSSSTGGLTDIHEVWRLQISPATPATDYSRCKGSGTYVTSAGSESFQFIGSVKKSTFGGKLEWKQGTSARFDGVVSACTATTGGAQMTGTGSLQIRTGKVWTSRTVSVQVTVEETSKTTPGSFTAVFDSEGTPLTTTGTLRTGSVQIR